MNQDETNSGNPSMPKKCPQCGGSLPAGALDGLCPACLLAQGVTAETGPEATPFQPPTVEEVARLFPQLEILTFIGKGGMGAVYKARQPGLDRLVALKILPPQVASGPGFGERFNREARALARLSHPNIVAVHEFGQVNGLPFFIMEFVDGLNLRQLERTRKLSAREALQIVPQICEALQFAHDEGIVHRDIKPDNILLDKKGRVKIADFGIAKLMGRDAEADLTATKGIIGTPNYMAPEQVEKPETVDHRADIFALGVVFYEMLTGELPLGKFAPPSSGRVEVDVRLDEVVLRALEKKPELRYQQASQVKSAVETIASGGGASADHFVPPTPPNAEALIREVLARDYTLSIRSCLRRGWALVRSNFWPTVGISALIWVLLAIAQSAGVVIISGHDRPNGGGSVLGLLVSGPLMGGLYFYFLQKIRGQPVTIETAFAGFSKRFLHLFLGSLVSLLLTGLGFLCLILPGIYLWVAWTFTLPLIMDKRLDFWSAMELSRKMVTRHWWKLFGFVLILVLLHVAGFVAFCLGIFIAAPIATASLMYAYEDMFGGSGRLADQPASVGPHGTAVLGEDPAKPSASGVRGSPAKAIGLAVSALVILAIAVIVFAGFIHLRARRAHEHAVAAQEAADAQLATARQISFGPMREQTIQARTTGTNQFLDLDAGTLLTPASEITSVLAAQAGEDENRLWQTLDIREDSGRFRYVAWLRESGTDLMFAGDGRIIGFDGVFAKAHGDSSTSWNDWDALSAERVVEAIDVMDWSRRASEASRFGQPAPPAPTSGGIVNSAVQLDSQYGGGPLVNLLTREQSELWFFKTREGARGVLQIVQLTNDPSAVKIRYKLVVTGPAESTPREDLASRLEAAANISGTVEKDAALANLARDAAKSGKAELVGEILEQIGGNFERDQAALESVRLLAQRGMRKPAIEIAKSITSTTIRDMALSELAR
ncbi:MAG: protein kinase [Verrucomicrobia bacterium]|nr:protein kinase [Verrucomicrobiota bacterium]